MIFYWKHHFGHFFVAVILFCTWKTLASTNKVTECPAGNEKEMVLEFNKPEFFSEFKCLHLLKHFNMLGYVEVNI